MCIALSALSKTFPSLLPQVISSIRKLPRTLFFGNFFLSFKRQRWRKKWLWIFGSLVDQIKSFFKVLKLKQIFQKNKVVTGKTPLFVIGLFNGRHSICFNIYLWQRVFNEKDACSILVALTKKRYSTFLKKLFVFEKIGFNANPNLTPLFDSTKVALLLSCCKKPNVTRNS